AEAPAVGDAAGVEGAWAVGAEAPRLPRPPPRAPAAAVVGVCDAGPFGRPIPPAPCCACCPNGRPGRRTNIRCLLSGSHIGIVSKSTPGDMYLADRAAMSYTTMKL